MKSQQPFGGRCVHLDMEHSIRRFHRRSCALVAASVVLLGSLAPVVAQSLDDDEDDAPLPVRLSFLQGSVSFWRAGGDDWVAARLNTPLAPGDHVYAAEGSRFELQFGPDSFVRGDASTDLVVQSIDPDYVQFRVSKGTASLDIRTFDRDAIVELTTPHVAMSTRRAGYYRLDVADETSVVVARRGGDADLVSEKGETWPIGEGEQVVVDTRLEQPFSTYRATEPDGWDRWSWERSERIVTSESSRHLPRGVYGGEVLDEYGTWRDAPEYGRVWYPNSVAPGWAPYSSGHWIWDAGYGWTWIDVSPWGWAPFHYGRWVYVNSVWGWAPGPLVRRPFYSPAVVGFLTTPRVGISIGFGVPPISWVALGWGEPLIPWWGRAGFIGAPCWRGWGGPRMVNNRVIVNNYYDGRIDRIVYGNTRVRNAVLVQPRDRFGRTRGTDMARWRDDVSALRPVRGNLPVRPTRESLMPRGPRGAQVPRPSQRVLERSTIATRRPSSSIERMHRSGVRLDSARVREPRVIVPDRFSRRDATRVGVDPRIQRGQDSRSGAGRALLDRDRRDRIDRPDGSSTRQSRRYTSDPLSRRAGRDRVMPSNRDSAPPSARSRADHERGRGEYETPELQRQRPPQGERSVRREGYGGRIREPQARLDREGEATRRRNDDTTRRQRPDRPAAGSGSTGARPDRIAPPMPLRNSMEIPGRNRDGMPRAQSYVQPRSVPEAPSAPRGGLREPDGRQYRPSREFSPPQSGRQFDAGSGRVRSFDDRPSAGVPRMAPGSSLSVGRPRDMGMRSAPLDRAPVRGSGDRGAAAASGPSGRGERGGSRRGER